MTAKRRASWRSVKKHHSYTVEDAARAVNVSLGTVRRWIKDGLPAIRDRKPTLILGEDLANWLKSRGKPKTKLGDGQCYCLRCRAARGPAGGLADFRRLNPHGGNLQALCDVCGTLMYRRISNTQLEAWRPFLEVSEQQAAPDITKCGEPCLNDHLRED